MQSLSCLLFIISIGTTKAGTHSILSTYGVYMLLRDRKILDWFSTLLAGRDILCEYQRIWYYTMLRIIF